MALNSSQKEIYILILFSDTLQTVLKQLVLPVYMCIYTLNASGIIILEKGGQYTLCTPEGEVCICQSQQFL